MIQLNSETDTQPRQFILVQIPEAVSSKDLAFKAGFKHISDITIKRNKRVVARVDEAADAAEREAKQQLPGIVSQQSPAYRSGFKVYRLSKSRFPRTEFVPDPVKTDDENLEMLDAYIREKESAFLMTFNRDDILLEVLLKNGFMLDVKTEALADFTENIVFRTWDSHKEATICLDYDLKEQTIAKLKGMEGIFVCLEQSLDTTKKWNLRAEFGERFVPF